MRIGTTAGLLALAVLGLAGPASATNVIYDEYIEDGEDHLAITAGKKERNDIVIARSGKRFVITERGAPLRVLDASCKKLSRTTVSCPVTPELEVDLRDGDDRIRLDLPGAPGDDAVPAAPEGLEPARLGTIDRPQGPNTVVAGSGNDVVIGSAARDYVLPGPGRDRLDLRGGPDEVIDNSDRARDVLNGGPGINLVNFEYGGWEVRVDTRAGTADFGRPRETDRLNGFRKIIGSYGDDTLLGGDAGEMLEGSDGVDRVEGRGGDDYLLGDDELGDAQSGRTPDRWRPNVLKGGPGNDRLDARSTRPAPTSLVDCGAGDDDRVAGNPDDRISGCESSAFDPREPLSFTPSALLFAADFRTTVPTAPVARAADGTPTYRLTCPKEAPLTIVACNGTLRLQTPPVKGRDAVTLLGSAPFSLAPGASADVPVALTAAGRAALARPGALVAVHVQARLTPDKNLPLASDFGWQARL